MVLSSGPYRDDSGESLRETAELRVSSPPCAGWIQRKSSLMRLRSVERQQQGA